MFESYRMLHGPPGSLWPDEFIHRCMGAHPIPRIETRPPIGTIATISDFSYAFTWNNEGVESEYYSGCTHSSEEFRVYAHVVFPGWREYSFPDDIGVNDVVLQSTKDSDFLVSIKSEFLKVHPRLQPLRPTNKKTPWRHLETKYFPLGMYVKPFRFEGAFCWMETKGGRKVEFNGNDPRVADDFVIAGYGNMPSCKNDGRNDIFIRSIQHPNFIVSIRAESLEHIPGKEVFEMTQSFVSVKLAPGDKFVKITKINEPAATKQKFLHQQVGWVYKLSDQVESYDKADQKVLGYRLTNAGGTSFDVNSSAVEFQETTLVEFYGTKKGLIDAAAARVQKQHDDEMKKYDTQRELLAEHLEFLQMPGLKTFCPALFGLWGKYNKVGKFNYTIEQLREIARFDGLEIVG